MSLMMSESHSDMLWDSLPISTQIDIEAAAHSDDWQKLIWLMESSVVTFDKMVFHIFSLNLEDPLINVLIAFEKTALALEVIEVLPDLKLKELEKKNFKGDTALHVAATMENIRIARALLDKHPKLTFMTNNLNETPLHKAALNGHRDIFWELLVRGSNVRARRYDGVTLTLKTKMLFGTLKTKYVENYFVRHSLQIDFKVLNLEFNTSLGSHFNLHIPSSSILLPPQSANEHWTNINNKDLH